MKANPRWLLSAVLCAGILFLPGNIFAQECTINQFGGPNKFVDDGTINEIDLVRVFKDHRAEIERVLGEVGWKGDPQDLFHAVETGAAEDAKFPPGTPFKFMLLRYKGEAHAAVDKCWGGKTDFAAWKLVFDSNGYKWTFAVPKQCGNLALIRSEQLPPPPPPPAPEPEPEPEPEPMPVVEPEPEPAPAPPPPPPPYETQCLLRAFGLKAYGNDDVLRMDNLGTPNEFHIEQQVENGEGFGIEGECLVKPRLGIALTLLSVSHDSMRMTDTPTEWLMDHADLDWLGLTAGINYHFTRQHVQRVHRSVHRLRQLRRSDLQPGWNGRIGQGQRGRRVHLGCAPRLRRAGPQGLRLLRRSALLRPRGRVPERGHRAGPEPGRRQRRSVVPLLTVL